MPFIDVFSVLIVFLLKDNSIESKPRSVISVINESFISNVVLYHWPSFQELRLNQSVSRLEDLTPDMRKKVKTLALIELSAVLDMYGLELEKIKRKKTKKRTKSELWSPVMDVG